MTSVLTKECDGWFVEGRERNLPLRRRLAFICSVAARRKYEEDQEFITIACEFHVRSWTEDESIEAVRADEVRVRQRFEVPRRTAW